MTAGEVRISEHGYDEMAEDGIRVRDVLDGVAECILVEDYPSFGKGPSVLVLDRMPTVSQFMWSGASARPFESRRCGDSLSARSDSLVRRLHGAPQMRKRTKYIHEGKYVAEVDVELIEADDDWAPYLSVEDAERLDEVRDLLRAGNLEGATQRARVFELKPIAQSQ